jgi:hypothetical protein
MISANQTIYHDAAHPSVLTLPIMPNPITATPDHKGG